jgi:hypothetical protein
MSSTISSRPVKKIFIIVCFVPIWRAGSLGWHLSTIVKTFLRPDNNRNIRARTHHHLRFLQNGSLPTRVELRTSLLTLQHEQPFGQGTGNGAPSAAINFQSQLSLKNVINRRHARQEVLHKYSGTGNGILLKKCRTLRPQGQGRAPLFKGKRWIFEWADDDHFPLNNEFFTQLYRR